MAYNFSPGNARDLEKNGTWFRDREGRFVNFRGVNFTGTSKLPPYLPFRTEDFDSVQPDLDRLRELGFNIVRLLLIWKPLEENVRAQPEVLTDDGRTYLENLRKVIDTLYQRGIFVFIDVHQDIAHEYFGGDGFPDWARAIDSSHPLPRSPAGFTNKFWALNYALDTDYGKLCRHTLASFWLNDLRNDTLTANEQLMARHVQEHYVKIIGAVAGFFQKLNNGTGHPAIIGYSIFNEPHETELKPDSLEKDILPTLYRNARVEIRKAQDFRSFIFIQPRVGWNQFTLDPTSDLNTSELEGERTVFTYNHYDSWSLTLGFGGQADSMENKQKEWPLVYDRMRATAVWRNLIPLISELGAPHDWTFQTNLRPEIYHNSQIRAYMDLQMQQVDKYVQNFTYWNYSLYNTEELKDGWNLEDFSLLGPGRQPRDVDIVSRPYAMRSSAEPLHAFFDLGTKHFALRLRGPVVDAPTVLFVPRRLHYPSDFEVRASTDNVLEWDDARQLLYWWPAKSRDQNLIVICPFGRFRNDALPFFAREVIGVINQPIRMPAPFGSFDNAVVVNNKIEVSGWAIDAETAGPLNVSAQIDNVVAATASANFSRPDIGAMYPGYGNNHGFLMTLKTVPGQHRVCVFASNVGGGSNVRLGCRDIFVPLPGPCGTLFSEVTELQQQIAFLQEQLLRARIQEKAEIRAEIGELRVLLAEKQAELDACIKREMG